MLCQSCGKNPATIHYKSSINGKVTESFFCAECAAKSGVTSNQKQLPIDLIDGFFGKETNDIFGDLFAGMMKEKGENKIPASVCPKCGMRFSDFTHHGKIGCSECYNAFKNSLYPTIKKLHGASSHCGKVPEQNAKQRSKMQKIDELRSKLGDAIAKQEYEMAAKYRDEIRELENKKEEEN